MGSLQVIEFVTLDGVMQGLHGPDEEGGFRHGGWGTEYADEIQFHSALESLPSTGAYLLGRRTYEELARFWPFQPDDNPMAFHLNKTPKFVVTHRHEGLQWQNSRPLEGALTEGINQLKETTSSNIVVLGSGNLVAQLFAADLVDGVRLFVHPIVLGSGRRLCPPAERPVRLRLREVGQTSTDVLMLSYDVVRTEPRRSGRPPSGAGNVLVAD
jgi:dihydrofolate reductase